MLKKAFPPIANQHSKILLLGTMPGEQSLKLQQYYGHKSNHFWKIIFQLFNQPITDDYKYRVQLVLSKGIAVWDVLQYCERAGSADNNIQNEIPNDFVAFYKKYPQIQQVFFASTQAQIYYDTYIKRKPHFGYHLLPSPSSANARKKFEEKLEDWRLILEWL